MSNYIATWAEYPGALYLMSRRENAETDLGDVDLTAPYVLWIGREDGDGLVIEGEAEELLVFVEQLATHVRKVAHTERNRRLQEG